MFNNRVLHRFPDYSLYIQKHCNLDGSTVSLEISESWIEYWAGELRLSAGSECTQEMIVNVIRKSIIVKVHSLCMAL